MLNMPMRLMLIVRANPASVCGPSLPTTFSPWTMPAQLTSPCRPPNAAAAAATAALPLASSVTSVRTNRAFDAELRGERLPFRFLEVGDHDAPAAGGQHPRHRRAQARRAAGDDEGISVQLHGSCFSVSLWKPTRVSLRSTPGYLMPGYLVFNIVVIDVTKLATSARFDGTISVLPVFARFANAAT